MLDMITLIIVGAGILQLPLIMDVIQYLFPQSKLGRAVTTGMRWILVTAMIFSCVAAVYMHFTLLLREHVNGYQNQLQWDESSLGWLFHPLGLLHGLFSIWVFVQLLNHFYDATSKAPSRIQKSTPDSNSNGTVLVAPAMTANRDTENDKTFCQECRVPKLLRTHHCRNCRTCVELMDHHCPFTGNCVGLLTFRSFYLWLCYGFVGISYATYISFWSFKYCWYDGIIREKDPERYALLRQAHIQATGEMCARLGRGSYLFLPVVFGFLSTLFIFVFQTLLIYADMTTIEYLHGLTQFKIGIHAPKEVKEDADKRANQTSTGRKRRQNASPSSSSSDSSSLSELEFEELDDESNVVELMESGSSTTTTLNPTTNSSTAATSSSTPTASPSYNPHKSFTLLILQHGPISSLFIPPILQRQHRTPGARSNH